MNISLHTKQQNFVMWLCQPIQPKEKTQFNAIAGVCYCIWMFIGSNCVGSKAPNKAMHGIGKTKCLYKFVMLNV